MSKRLQVLLPDPELLEIKRLAQIDQLSVGEWVRRTLREARNSRPSIDTETRLKAVRRGAAFAFPTSDVEQMLSEIESGYKG